MAAGFGATCAKVLLIIFNLIFWLTGVVLIIFGTWMIVDPQRSYLLDLVNFSEQDPLLKIAAYIFIFSGCAIVVVGFLGCCGALKEVQCMLVVYTVFLALIFFAELSAGILAIVFKTKFSSNYMKEYLYNKTHYLYGRQTWVSNLVDTIQYYQKCCGSSGAQDWTGSYWQKEISGKSVPDSCCTQLPEATPRQLVPKHTVRCQQPTENYVAGQWRHSQTQESRPPDRIEPVDPNCRIYDPDDPNDIRAFNHSVYTQGCHEKLLKWFEQHAVIFISLGVSLAVFQLFGILLSICLCRNVRDDT